MGKLPVLATVARSYGFARGNLPAIGLLARRWAIAAAIAFALSWLLVRQAFQADAEPGFEPATLNDRVAAMTSLSVLIALVATYVIVVRWHRILIQGLSPAETQRHALSGGMLYFARGFLLGGIGLIIGIAGLFPAALMRGLALPEEAKPIVVGLSFGSAAVAALLVVSRLSLVLPAGAVGDFAMTFRRSWILTRGNSWRIFLGSLLASGPAIAVNLALNGLLEQTTRGPNDAVALTIGIAFSIILTVIAAVIQASFLSYTYLHFTRSGEVPRAAGPE